MKHLNDTNINTATAQELYDLLMLHHPDEKGYSVSRIALLREWENRNGEELTKEIGLPAGKDYPYKNRYTNNVMFLDNCINHTGGHNCWWGAHEHWEPVKDCKAEIFRLQTEIEKELSKPKKPKSKKNVFDKDYCSDFEIEQLNCSLECLYHYLNAKPEPTTEIKPVSKEPLLTAQVDGLTQIVLPLDVEEIKAKRNPDDQLFGYQAKDKADRQRFKRKLERTRQWLQELPATEARAIKKMVSETTTPPRFGRK